MTPYCSPQSGSRVSAHKREDTDTVLPTDGYVLSVDGKLKARFEGHGEAFAEGLDLKQAYPVLQI
jgi:hypothetical protein